MKRLILLGGGHAHLTVLADLAQRPLDGWDVQLVSPFRRQIYSGMLPGWVAGHYPLASCAIALDALADRAKIAFHRTGGVALDPGVNTLTCADGKLRNFDVLSLDIGPAPALDGLPGGVDYALPIRPIEGFAAAWPSLLERIAGRSINFHLVVLGAGAAGLELAFAIRHRALQEGWGHLRVSLVGSDVLPLEGASGSARARAMRALSRRRIGWHGPRRAVRIREGAIDFAEGDALAFDGCLVATGAAAPAWLAASGLTTDDRGFVRVGPTLQSTSHQNILAGGDVASSPWPLPKSGVYAVRAGPVLSENLRAICGGRPPQPWVPQARALYLVSTGDRNALALWGRWCWEGPWVWRWKDRIDRAFVRRYGTQA
ncbi:MAG: FAD-dependent oxidoreductase [Pseudomonadota bacterium]|nr:FAD-dependent oxidoreductase [Pseudomonadota bacterium]